MLLIVLVYLREHRGIFPILGVSNTPLIYTSYKYTPYLECTFIPVNIYPSGDNVGLCAWERKNKPNRPHANANERVD